MYHTGLMWIPVFGLVVLGLAFQPTRAGTDPAALLRAGQFDAALSAVRDDLKSHPHDARLLTMEGIALTQLGHEQLALQSYRRALAAAPDYLPAMEGAAQIEYKLGDAAAAIPHLDKLIEINANDQTAHAMRGVLAARAGKCSQAVEDFGAASDAIAHQPDAVRQYGTCLFRSKRWPEAERTFGSLLAANSRDVRAAYGVAAAQIEAGEYEQAVSTLKPFAEDGPALALSANALEELGRTPEAIADLRSAILAEPRRESFYTQFAELCFTYKSYQAGVDLLNAGLTQLPGSAKLYLARGILRVQQGNYDAADADFAAAERLDPKEASGADAAVLALVQANHLDEAERVLAQKLNQHPRDAELYFFQADVLNRQGDAHGSMAAAQRAVALRPDFVMAHDLLARLYQEAGDVAKAVQECQAALKSDPEDETALYRWLRILSARHQAGDASAIESLTDRWNKTRQKLKEEDLRESRYRIFTSP
jgi:tetratricopeptide (TPR) repeat protein